jgi:hypothetical protein
MKLSTKHSKIANRIRQQIQRETETIDDGEGVAMILLWSFLSDHARVMELDVEQLAREQLDSFMGYARVNFEMVKEH